MTRFVALALCVAACNGHVDPPEPPAMTSNAGTVVLKQSQVGVIEGERVGVTTVGDAEYELPSGAKKSGPTAQLSFASTNKLVIVGVGSAVEVGGARYDVIGIDTPLGQRASVTLRKQH